MKKQVMIAAGLALLSTSAYATKARMDALQQANGRGSEYIKDTRSIFRNAAHVNTFKNYVVTEWGENQAGVNADSEGATQAEGGFFKEAGNFSYGVYLGSQLDSQNDIRDGGSSYAQTASASAASTFGNANLEQHNDQVDLFFGGDMGVEWGVNLNHAYSKQEGASANLTEAKHSSWGMGAGVVVGDLELYLNHRFSDKSTGQAGSPSSSSSTWEGKHTLIGAAFGWNNYTFYANYDVRQAEFVDNSSAANTTPASNETERKTFRLGAGKIHNISSSSRVYTDATFQVQTSRDKLGNQADSPKVKDTTLPLVIGFETDANSWLTLRGSVSQNFLLKTQKLERRNGTNVTQEQTIDGNVNVNAGATLNFGKLKIDGAIGTTNTAGNATGAGNEDGDLRLDRLMGRVAVHYWF